MITKALFLHLFIISIVLSTQVISAIYILFKFPKSTPTMLFFIKRVVISIVIFSGLMMQGENKIFWVNMMHINILLIPTLLVHFYVLITDLYKNRLLDIIIYLPFVVIAFLIIIMDNPLNIVIIDYKGITIYKKLYPTLFGYIFYFYILLYVVFAIITITRWNILSNQKRIKQSSIIQGVTVFVIYTGIISSALLIGLYSPLFMPYVASLALPLYSIHIAYILRNHKFLGNNNSDYFDAIMNNITDYILFINSEGNVLKHNDIVKCFYTHNKSKTRQLDLYKLLNDEDMIKFLSFKESNQAFCNELFDFNFNTNHIIHSKCYLSKIYDQYNDLAGILLIGKEDLNSYHLMNRYSLSHRHVEIIKLIAKDNLSSKTIGEKLSISHRTVESHIHTIFNKFGIKTRFELMNRLTEYQL